jgi:type I restriction enzyme M protein
MKVFDSKENIEHFAKYIDNDVIAQNDYNLSVSSYVESEDTREIVDINKLNAELKSTVLKIDALRSEIDKIVESIENE